MPYGISHAVFYDAVIGWILEHEKSDTRVLAEHPDEPATKFCCIDGKMYCGSSLDEAFKVLFIHTNQCLSSIADDEN